MILPGLHHVTAIASDARRNVDFYTRVLGLRLVKKTVNFDDPGTYHFYYGDGAGSPGSILTFFPWSGLTRGRPGTGQANATAFSVSRDALPFWRERFARLGVATKGESRRFDDEVLAFEDPDGLPLELVATNEPDARVPWTRDDIPAGAGLRGFHHVTLALRQAAPTERLLVETMGFRLLRAEGGRRRFTTGAGGPGTYVDLLVDRTVPSGLQGAGTVHHIAFRTPDRATQDADRRSLLDAGFNVSAVRDRNYFESIYYREPEGILFEIATDPPGFAIDETPDSLGTALKLPAQYEPHRAQIEASLPVLT